MTSTLPETESINVRLCQHRDLEVIERLVTQDSELEGLNGSEEAGRQFEQMRRWYGLLKGLSLFPNPYKHLLSTYVAEQDSKIRGMIQVSPFNRTRSTWRVDQLIVDAPQVGDVNQPLPADIGSQLLRYCLQTLWEARTWLIEGNVNSKAVIALCRQNGFQPLAHMTYWAIAPEQLQTLANREPDLPNLLPVSNADAGLLHQLDTMAVPPLVRQVYDRHVVDFKTGMFDGLTGSFKRWLGHTESVKGYVFEPQRKAAIGYFEVKLCRNASQPHTAELTVHPAYTWLYPELLSQMARVTRAFPEQPLYLTSADYHAEREEYLQQVGATRTEHTLLLSRSVWHKLREAKPLEGLQLAEVLQNLQAARKPVPSRFSLFDSIRHLPHHPKRWRTPSSGNGEG